MEFPLITAQHRCPYRFSITKGQINDNHFNRHLELFMVLRGNIVCTLPGHTYALGSRDFIFINPYEIHSITQAAPDTTLITLEIELAAFKPLFQWEDQAFFHWDETYNNRDLSLYQEVSGALRSIITLSINQEPAWLALVNQEITRILIAMSRHCDCSPMPDDGTSPVLYQTRKAAEIMEHLNAHYMEPVSLQSISEAIHLSSPYISKLFKKTFGVGVLEYLNQLRIQKSLSALENSSAYILDIAISVGFNNAKTYGRLFQQIMGLTPSEYRSQHLAQPSSPLPDQQEAMSQLLSFLADAGYGVLEQSSATGTETISIHQDFLTCTTHTHPRKWNRTVSVGMAALLLQKNIQQEILDAVQDMGFEYVRFTGVLSDNLQIYQENMDGEPIYFWVLLDEILDFLRRNHLKPFICLGFVPEKLASRRVPSPYYWNANTAMPRSLSRWADYLRAFLQHLVTRYGYEEVCTWKFEFWNAAELKGVFWHDSDEAFQKFFLTSYHAFREVLPEGVFGSPGFVKFKNFNGAREFLQFCTHNKVRFDFVCLHSFMITDPAQNDRHLSHIMSLGPDLDIQEGYYLNHSVQQFHAVLQEVGIHAPIYITEWNISPYFHDLSRDTCFMSAYIANTINHLPEEVEEISFWALTDYMEEHIPHQDLFTGELGIKTHNGLPKPAYLAFALLHRMRENLVTSGDGYFITASSRGYQILLYNYSFYSQEFITGQSHKLGELDRYQIFEAAPQKLFQLHLRLPSGNYRIEHHVLNRDHGSIYDDWVRMGAPRHIDTATYRCLHNKAYPDINIRHQNVEEHLLLSEQVPVHGMELILLTQV